MLLLLLFLVCFVVLLWPCYFVARVPLVSCCLIVVVVVMSGFIIVVVDVRTTTVEITLPDTGPLTVLRGARTLRFIRVVRKFAFMLFCALWCKAWWEVFLPCSLDSCSWALYSECVLSPQWEA